MSKALYHSEKIKEYLLGSLSTEETERLDELSITNAEFVEALATTENELIDAYVLGELDQETRRKFESRYQSTSLRSERVEFAKTLQQLGQQASPGAITQGESSHRLSWLKSHLSTPSILQWGFATAAVVLLVAAIWLAFQNVRLRSEVSAVRAHNNELARSQLQLERELEEAQRSAQVLNQTPGKSDHDQTIDQAASSTVLSLVLTPLVRGSQQKPTIDLKSETTAVTVKLLLEPNDFLSYRVELLPQKQKPVWRASNLKAQTHNGSRSLVVTLPVRVLKDQDFVLRVSGSSGNGAAELIGDYPFTVSRAHHAP